MGVMWRMYRTPRPEDERHMIGKAGMYLGIVCAAYQIDTLKLHMIL